MSCTLYIGNLLIAPRMSRHVFDNGVLRVVHMEVEIKVIWPIPKRLFRDSENGIWIRFVHRFRLSITRYQKPQNSRNTLVQHPDMPSLIPSIRAFGERVTNGRDFHQLGCENRPTPIFARSNPPVNPTNTFPLELSVIFVGEFALVKLYVI